MFWKKKVEDIYQECKQIDSGLTSKTACATGYRPMKCPWGYNEQDQRCLEMRDKLKSLVEKSITQGYENFISGMALGFDMIFAEVILELKKKYSNIKLIAALPCKNQYEKWPANQIKRYKSILSKCDSVRCLYDTYNDKCMLERNDYMLNNSSLVFALYDGKPGGTKYTINKAKQKGLKVEEIKQ